MYCPHCHEPLIIIEYQQIELDYCLKCEGIWLDQGELEFVLKLPTSRIDLSAVESFSKSKRRCPRCRKRMVKGNFPNSTVEVDICRRDGGIWLDKGEILDIAKMQCPEQTFKNIQQFFTELFVHKNEIQEE